MAQEKKPNYMQELIDRYKQGTSIQQLAEEYPNLFARNYNNIMRTLDLICHSTPRSTKTEVWWLYGKTGTGKSSKALQMAEAKPTYWKNSTEWWDHYEQQEV
ncbi:hypothetical protein X801_08178, partial [Opisthorchis viverrini]